MQWHTMDSLQTLEALGTSKDGLSGSEAASRLARYGENRLEDKKREGFAKKLVRQLSDFMIIILIAAAAISFVTSLIQGEADYVDPIIILLIVAVNAVIGIVQESKAERAIAALQGMAPPHVRLHRGGKLSQAGPEILVPGDIIALEAGDSVPADARLLEAVQFKVEESSLTGESEAVEKHTDAIAAADLAVSERKNMVFCGSLVMHGRALAVVTDTGMSTQMGKIAGLLESHGTPPTPLQKKLEETGRFLGIAALMVCAGIFVLGVLQRVMPLDMFLISVSLAVAAIPEGLPAIVTIVLALGVQRMAASRAVIRRLPAVETLGAATVICADKTGTLTQNKMAVRALAGADGEQPASGGFASELLSYACLCSNAEFSGGGETGDPTEAALLRALPGGAEAARTVRSKSPRVREFSFDSYRKRMSTVHSAGGGFLCVAKGAPEWLLERCTHARIGGESAVLTPQLRARILRICEGWMRERALRVIAVAYKRGSADWLDADSAESGLTFLGIAGLADPLRPEVAGAVKKCRSAGIRPIMITGDHVATAAAVAREAGILRRGDYVLTGADIDGMDEERLKSSAAKCSVFARVTPAHKVAIVRALQSGGEVVAMTGDGVNDAPALQAADIGCAMGISGTEVAKGAADMVLLDDNFSTIVEAVREGRGIYQNIRRAVHFLLSSNTGEIITLFTAFALRLPVILFPIQLLFVNLITDSLPALALGMEKPASDIMEAPPKKASEGLFAGGLWIRLLIEGTLIGGLALTAFMIGSYMFDVNPQSPHIGRTMAFCVLCLSQLVHAFNMRSERSLFRAGFFGNRYLTGACALCALVLVLIVSVPAASAVLKTVPLSGLQWLWCAALAVVPLAACEAYKVFSALKRRRTVAVYAPPSKIYIKV